MGFASRSPIKKEKDMFIVGIVVGAILSFLGSYMVTVTFRLVDSGYSHENIIIFIAPLILFIFLLKMIPNIIKKI